MSNSYNLCFDLGYLSSSLFLSGRQGIATTLKVTNNLLASVLILTVVPPETGFSEEALQQHHDVLKPLELTKPRGDIQIGGAKPDVWFEPKVVWEVLTADLSLSPIYTAAQGLVRPLLFAD